MTTVQATATTAPPDTPPLSRALRIVAGLALIAAGLLNGLPQFLLGLWASRTSAASRSRP